MINVTMIRTDGLTTTFQAGDPDEAMAMAMDEWARPWGSMARYTRVFFGESAEDVRDVTAMVVGTGRGPCPAIEWAAEAVEGAAQALVLAQELAAAGNDSGAHGQLEDALAHVQAAQERVAEAVGVAAL